jgi:hypothetical protein
MQHNKNDRMKHLKHLLLTLLIFTVEFSLFSQDNHCEKTANRSTISEHDILLSKEQTVYICTGTYSYAYHSQSNCAGLNNCKGQINYTDEYSAVNSFGRRPCCRCWSNVSGNCKDDNPSYGGGSSGEAYAFLAIAIVATSAVILSNDMYLYPAFSFYNPSKNKNQNGQQTSIGTGLLFGFRKTFKHSALEYGASYLKFEKKYNYTNGYTNTITQNRWGGHFNFVQQVFYNKTPKWLKVYFGPSVNYVFDFGYGGLIGTEMKLFDRLRFDVRYEWTTQTNQIQAGLIFTYQKKYFWQKK